MQQKDYYSRLSKKNLSVLFEGMKLPLYTKAAFLVVFDNLIAKPLAI